MLKTNIDFIIVCFIITTTALHLRLSSRRVGRPDALWASSYKNTTITVTPKLLAYIVKSACGHWSIRELIVPGHVKKPKTHFSQPTHWE